MDDRRIKRCGVAERGSALLAVLGTVAVLAAIAFSMAASARNALDRVSVRSDLNRAYFLARGGIESALHEMTVQVGSRRPVAVGQWIRRYEFGGGTVSVTAVSESGKLDVNRASRENLQSLLHSIGVQPARADTLANRITTYRSGLRSGWPRRFAPAQPPATNRRPLSSFERRRASIQMVEELLAVPGITPELLYGRYEPRQDGGAGLQRRSALLGLLRTSGPAAVDVNTAPREVLLAAGLHPSLADRLIKERRGAPILADSPLLDLAARRGSGVALAANAESSGWSLTALAKLDGNRAVRSVTALAGFDAAGRAFRVQRWCERAH